jgi:scyllo-inositol 2-dehydrogenase (NADP+)
VTPRRAVRGANARAGPTAPDTADRRCVALIGYGLAGRVFHGPLVRATPGLEMAAIVTRDSSRREQAALDFPAATLLETPDEVWAQRDQFDLVVIATTPGTHARLAREAIDAGLPLVVEKPLAVDAGEARALIDHAEARGVPMVPFHNRRWDSDQLTLRRLLQEQTLGTVHRYESRFERWRPQPNAKAWREALTSAEGGGVLLDLGTHLVDQAITLFGPVSRIYGEVQSRRGGADDDVFIALHHKRGVESHLWASALSAAPGPRVRVQGSAGAYIVQELDGQETALRGGAHPDDRDFGLEPQEHWGRLWRGDRSEVLPSEPGRWLTFYEGVAQTLRTGAPPPVEARDALLALEILDTVRGQADSDP